MAFDEINQEGIRRSIPGVGGRYQLKNANRGSSLGDTVDNSEGDNPVTVSFKRQLDLQDPSQSLAYAPGKSAAQEF